MRMKGDRPLFFLKKIFLAIKKVITLNIATIIFSALFLYMLITVFLYVTSSHVTSYQVTSGTLAKNPVCTALAIRSEEIVTSDQTGYIRYLAPDSTKVRKNGNVYAIGDSKLQTAEIPLSTDQLKKIQKKTDEFSNSFDSSDFYDTYSFKYQLEGIMIAENNLTSAPAEEFENESSEEEPQYDENGLPAVKGSNSIAIGNQTICTAPSAGLVAYYTDGYEDKTTENLSLEDFNQKSYQKKDLITTEELTSGTCVYKLITSDNWTLMVPISDRIASRLSGRSYIQVKFQSDGKSQNGQLSIVEIDGQKIAKIDLKNGMIRYASSRFLDVELVINTTIGLKIPTSSIVTKAFYLIPSSYLTYGGNNNEKGFLKQVITDEEDRSTEFVSATIYKNDAEEEEEETVPVKTPYCYVDKETLQEGDVLCKPDSSETFTVGEIDYLDGVYCMNKGYAVFRRIDTLQSNEEFCLVKKDTLYGLSEFDQIVLEGESVQEEDILTGK